MALQDYGVQSLQNRPLDWLETAGRGVNTDLLSQRSIPKAVAGVGSFLSAFGQSRAAHRALGEKRAIEAKLGVPLEFFLKLPADAQQEIWDKAQIGGQSYMDVAHPELGGLSYRQYARAGPGAKAVAPLSPTEELVAVHQRFVNEHQAEAYGTEQAGVKARTEATGLEVENLKAGKTRSGGIPAGAQKSFTPIQRGQIDAWKGRPENAGKSDLEAIDALFNIRLQQAWGPEGPMYANPDGSMAVDPYAAGVVPLFVNPRSGEYYRGIAGRATAPAAAPAAGVAPQASHGQGGAPVTVVGSDGQTYSFPDQASADAFKAEDSAAP